MTQKAILFDLDGTLVDSVPDLAAAVNALLAELGRPALSRAQVTGMVGDGAAKLVERALAASGAGDTPLRAALDRFLALYEADPTRLTRPYDGVPAVLAELAAAGSGLGICTNQPERALRTLLSGAGPAQGERPPMAGKLDARRERRHAGARRRHDPDLAVIGARRAVAIGRESRELDHVKRAAPQLHGLAALRRGQPLHTVIGEDEVITPPPVIDRHLDPAASGLRHGMADGEDGGERVDRVDDLVGRRQLVAGVFRPAQRGHHPSVVAGDGNRP